MRILLHMGQGKTGTTALQRALHLAREALAEQSVLYPVFDPNAVAHHLLIALCEEDARIPPHVVEPYGSIEMTRAKAAEALFRLRAEVEKSRPDTLVLSSETFVFGLRRPAKERLARLLRSMSDDILPIVYVREPAALYRARLLQKMRIAVATLPPEPQAIREAIEETEATFGKVSVRAFDSQQLQGGDIVTDFVSRFLSHRVDPSQVPGRRDNPSLSAEVALCISRFRALVAADRDWYEDPRSTRLIRHLLAVEKDDPPSGQVRLQPGLAEAIRRSSVDYLWLRDRYGIVFPELDYASIDGAPVAPDWQEQPLEGLIEVDRDRYDRLLLAALAREMRQGATG